MCTQVSEAAEILRYSLQTVIRLVDSKAIQGFRIPSKSGVYKNGKGGHRRILGEHLFAYIDRENLYPFIKVPEEKYPFPIESIDQNSSVVSRQAAALLNAPQEVA